MAKIKNKHHYSEDAERLKFLAEELEFIGRPYRLDLKRGVLIAYALPPNYTKRKRGKKAKQARNKRAESAARRS